MGDRSNCRRSDRGPVAPGRDTVQTTPSTRSGAIRLARPRFDPRDRARNFGPRINERIRVPEVRVIGAEGEMLGVMDTNDARRIAREADLDLVEVNPKAIPPVCKVMDFGKFKYEEKKKQREASKRQSQIELKEIKLRPKTDDHDIAFKINHIRRFLHEGNKVKLTVRFRGREITHPETAVRQIEQILAAIIDIAIIELPARMEAKTMIAIVAPKPGLPKRAPTPGQPEQLDDDDDDDDDDA